MAIVDYLKFSGPSAFSSVPSSTAHLSKNNIKIIIIIVHKFVSSDRSSYSDCDLLYIYYIYVMIFLLKRRLSIKMTIIHNSCLFDYYDKCYLH